MTEPEPVETDRAPSNDNPYSQGILDDGTLYISGYGPVDPATNEVVDGDIEVQTDQVLENIATVVEEAGGSGLEDVLKVTVYLTNLEDYDRVNDAYGARFGETPPARVCIEASRLPDDVRVELDAIASLE